MEGYIIYLILGMTIMFFAGWAVGRAFEQEQRAHDESHRP